jgi:hypothetical protein
MKKDYKKATPYGATHPPEVFVHPKRKPRNNKGKRRGQIVNYEKE